MSSTSAEVREYITLLLFCLHFLLFLAKAAAHHNGRYVYCIRDSQQPVCLHTQLLRRFIFMCASVSHTQFHLRLSFYLAESMGKDSCHAAKALLEIRPLFFPALPWINGSNKIEAYKFSIWLDGLRFYLNVHFYLNKCVCKCLVSGFIRYVTFTLASFLALFSAAGIFSVTSTTLSGSLTGHGSLIYIPC